MQRLTEHDHNSPQEYNRVWKERMLKDPQWSDIRRWNKLIRFFKGGRIIDLGVLDSLIPQMAKEKFPASEVWALDYADEVIEFYKEKYPDINYILGDVYYTHFPKNYFDYVVAGELIEHLERPEEFLKEAFRILRPKGYFMLSTPLNEALELGAVDEHRHIWSYDKEDMQKLLEPYGSVRVNVLRSRYWPTYSYAFPTMLVSCVKK